MKLYNQMSTLVFSLVLLAGITAQDTETRSLDGFDGIAVSQSIDAELVKGNKNQVEITVQNVDLDKVITEIDRGVLHLKMKKNWSGNWGKGKKKKVQIVVTYTEYPNYISASSSADVISADKIMGRHLELKASSSADMVLEVEVEDLEASVSSSADIEISGSADHADISASSSADFLGKRFTIGTADLSASSSADIIVRVTDEIEAKASSSGDISYYGSPKVRDIHKSSSGSVNRESGR